MRKRFTEEQQPDDRWSEDFVHPSRASKRGLMLRSVLVLLIVLAPLRLSATERVFRIFDERDGLTVSEVRYLAQDARGFLWVGTIGGLYRFDGREILPWGTDTLAQTRIEVLSTAPSGQILVGGFLEPLYWVLPDGVKPIAGPGGRPIEGWRHATLGTDGRVWIAFQDSLLWQDGRGDWTTMSAGDLNSGTFYRVRPAPADGAYVATTEALWLVSPDGDAQILAPVGGVHLVERRPDGATVFMTRWDGALYELRNGRVEVLIDGIEQGHGLAVRGDAVWASIDRYLYSIRPGEEPDLIAPKPHLPGGRPLLVDHEGSLWLGSYRGLIQFPEPETVTWNHYDGLPSPTRATSVAKTDEAVWVSTWYGLGSLMRIDGRLQAREEFGTTWARCCVDDEGRLWTANSAGFYLRRDGRFEKYPYPDPGLHGLIDCSRRPDGTLWLATHAGLFLSNPGVGPPRHVTTLPPPSWGSTWNGIRLKSLLEDQSGELWVAIAGEVCHARADAVAESQDVVWSCTSSEEFVEVKDLVELPSGSIWAGTNNNGVFRFNAEGWERIPGSFDLSSLNVTTMAPSPSGGVWILGRGNTVRVVERRDLPEGWAVVEQLTAWHGMPNPAAFNVLEESGGRIWIASWAGLTELSPTARHALKSPPRVEVVGVFVDGERRPPGEFQELPHRRNRLELHFAALSYRDRNLLRYQFRLRPEDAWSESTEPIVRFVDLPPGGYVAQIRATLDGSDWSPEPAALEFRVGRPWYLQAWAIAALVLLGGATLYLIYRLRLTFLLRLERQRMRIAMDLHDEMGSGLGSIGILSGLIAEEDVSDSGRRNLASRIGEAAGELGTALTDIVWSLRPGSDTLDALAYRLADRGARHFPDQVPAFTTQLPASVPQLKLSLDVSRNLQLITFEALHNAARHSGARKVVLGLEPVRRGWRLWVGDDGTGVSTEALSGETDGDGLRNMKRRAAEIGAKISWLPAPDGGTTVEVLFRPKSGKRKGRRAAGEKPPDGNGHDGSDSAGKTSHDRVKNSTLGQD